MNQVVERMPISEPLAEPTGMPEAVERGADAVHKGTAGHYAGLLA